MRYSYDIFPSKRIVVLKYAGSGTMAEFRRQTEELWADPRYSPSYDVLADLTAVTVPLVSPAEARIFAQFVASHPKTTVGRVAAVFSTPLETALAHIVQRIIRPRTPLSVFSSWDAACRFLGVEVKATAIPKV